MCRHVPDVLYFVRKACAPDWNLPDCTIPFCDLTFVVEGRATYELDGVPIGLAAGDAVFIPAGCRRAAYTDGMVCCAFNVAFPDGDPPLSGKLRWRDNERVEGLLRAFHRYWLCGEPYAQLKCDALFADLLYELLAGAHNTAHNCHVQRIKQYVSDHLAGHISVTAAAQYAGLSPVYCGALFRRHTGCTLAEYANRLRIEKAAAMLAYGDCNVSQAAYQCGFEDAAYFSRVFRRLKGVPPSAYREGTQL